MTIQNQLVLKLVEKYENKSVSSFYNHWWSPFKKKPHRVKSREHVQVYPIKNKWLVSLMNTSDLYRTQLINKIVMWMFNLLLLNYNTNILWCPTPQT